MLGHSAVDWPYLEEHYELNVIYKKHGSVLEGSLALTRLIYQTFLHRFMRHKNGATRSSRKPFAVSVANVHVYIY